MKKLINFFKKLFGYESKECTCNKCIAEVPAEHVITVEEPNPVVDSQPCEEAPAEPQVNTVEVSTPVVPKKKRGPRKKKVSVEKK